MQSSLQAFFKSAAEKKKPEYKEKAKRERKRDRTPKVEKMLQENPIDESGKSKSFIKPIELISSQSEVALHQKVMINNTEVLFPKKPYDIQVAYMSKVIESLDKGENALLQSPTGTGKTLCLLCSSIAWMKKERERQRTSENNNRIIDCYLKYSIF